MKEENILNKHQATLCKLVDTHHTVAEVTYSLRDDGEEAIQNTCSHVGAEARCGRAPDGCSKSHGCEEHQDWQSAKVGRKPYCEKTSRT